MDRMKTIRERNQALRDMDPLIETCRGCTLRGKSTMDRKLECCETCPTQKSIEFVKFRLDKTLSELRAMR